MVQLKPTTKVAKPESTVAPPAPMVQLKPTTRIAKPEAKPTRAPMVQLKPTTPVSKPQPKPATVPEVALRPTPATTTPQRVQSLQTQPRPEPALNEGDKICVEGYLMVRDSS